MELFPQRRLRWCSHLIVRSPGAIRCELDTVFCFSDGAVGKGKCQTDYKWQKENHENSSLTVRRVKRQVPDKCPCIMEHRMNIFKLVSFGKLHQFNPTKHGWCNRDLRGSEPTAIAGARGSPQPAGCTLFSCLIRTNQT